MTKGYGASFRWRRGKGAWRFWWNPSNLRGSKGMARPVASRVVPLSLPDGDDNVLEDARHTLDTLDLGTVAEA